MIPHATSRSIFMKKKMPKNAHYLDIGFSYILCCHKLFNHSLANNLILATFTQVF
uniref:Uncharacterized protein n=1 Tax=Populus trichocarpa TaxID=3694 RepID=A9PEQ5_POPTR|nr:unknown [Populus trichocarpa]